MKKEYLTAYQENDLIRMYQCLYLLYDEKKDKCASELMNDLLLILFKNNISMIVKLITARFKCFVKYKIYPNKELYEDITNEIFQLSKTNIFDYNPNLDRMRFDYFIFKSIKALTDKTIKIYYGLFPNQELYTKFVKDSPLIKRDDCTETPDTILIEKEEMSALEKAFREILTDEEFTVVSHFYKLFNSEPLGIVEISTRYDLRKKHISEILKTFQTKIKQSKEIKQLFFSRGEKN